MSCENGASPRTPTGMATIPPLEPSANHSERHLLRAKSVSSAGSVPLLHRVFVGMSESGAKVATANPHSGKVSAARISTERTCFSVQPGVPAGTRPLALSKTLQPLSRERDVARRKEGSDDFASVGSRDWFTRFPPVID